MSLTDAAKLAGVARNTWMTAESGARAVRDQNFAGIEAAMRWVAGSVASVMHGGEPTVAEPAPAGRYNTDPPHGYRPIAPSQYPVPHMPRSDVGVPFDVTAEVDRIRRLNLPAEARLRLIRGVLDLYEELAQEEGERRASQEGGVSPPS